MKKRIFGAAVNALLAFAGVFAMLFIMAEIERREDAELAAMLKKHQVKHEQTKWDALNKAGCDMTNCKQIGTAKWAQ